MKRLSTILALLIFTQCGPQQTQEPPQFSIDYEKFTLDNGLDVIFHIDRSDPVVAVALTFHVGSAREKEGRTGFAHLFEHLFFLESENLGKGGLDKMSSRIGGSGANGSTSRDRTNYFQTVPNDALEKMLWAEADKLGFFINTVTEQVLAKEKQVVKNEKRQSVDNRPYGHANYVVDKNLYPEGHPYSWQVIGSLEDLQNSTLEDVKEFHSKWYGPNNATLVVAGDFDTEQAKVWIHKYFDEIPGGAQIEPMVKQPSNLDETKLRYYEDNFARLPELRMVWPSVERYHPDAYALDILASLLSEGQSSPFYQVLVKELQLSSAAYAFTDHSELSGEFTVLVRAFEGTKLDEVKSAIDDAFAKFESEGIAMEDLDRIKAGLETDFYNNLSSVLGKAFSLAQYNIFAGNPGYINDDIQRTLQVTKEDVMRVYEIYIKNKNFVSTSFVPKGKSNLRLEGSTLANVVEEQIVQGAEEEFVLPEASEYTKTPSSFDRSVEPPYGPKPAITPPTVWNDTYINGLRAYGIETDELPLVQLRIRLQGGLLLDNPEKVGVANLTAEMMTKGSLLKNAEEFEKAIDQLGASINVSAGDQATTITANTLAKNLDATVALIQEMLLQPAWDAEQFKLTKQDIESQLAQQLSSPNAIASLTYARLMYGEEHILSQNILGTKESLSTITIDDLKAYHQQYYSPKAAVLHIVGDVDQFAVARAFDGIVNEWTGPDVVIPKYPIPDPPATSKVFFYDVPGAKQSVLRFGYMAMEETHPDYYPAVVMNYILGGGGFASRLTQELREGKGYTYGIGSSFSGDALPGPFTISSGVRSNVTLESALLVKEILNAYPETFSETDLSTTKSFLLKSNARSFETMGAKLRMLTKLSAYGWDPSYISEREEIVENMTIEQISQLARKYADPNKMIYLVVGDAETQLQRMKDLGFGDPVILNLPIAPEM